MLTILIRGLAQYFPPVSSLSKQKCTMRHGMKKTRSLTVIRYAACLIDLNACLTSFPGETLTDNIGVTEINKILLNIISNIWSKHVYVQGFDCESITLENSVNIFKRMEIAESIYEGVAEH